MPIGVAASLVADRWWRSAWRIKGKVGEGGQVAVGKDIRQQQSTSISAASAAEREELRDLLAELRTTVAAEASPELRERAVERIDELEEAVLGEEPDVPTIIATRNWFVKRLPQLAGAVTAVVVNPIVGKFVAAVGDAAVAELKEHLG
jgi:hypothetical protein